MAKVNNKQNQLTILILKKMAQELINAKLDELNSLSDLEPDQPTIPVSIVLQEAEDLFEWCSMDKDDLLKVGLDWGLVDDLKIRAGALRDSQSKWSARYRSYQDCQKEWKVAAPEAFNLRDELLHNLYYALYDIPSEYSKVQRIAEGNSNADMLQDLNDLAELGTIHSEKLEAIGVNLELLTEAKTMSHELAGLLAKVNGSYSEVSPRREIRNKANAHLKEAVDKIRRAGQFVFWRDDERIKGYASKYTRRSNQTRKSK